MSITRGNPSATLGDLQEALKDTMAPITPKSKILIRIGDKEYEAGFLLAPASATSSFGVIVITTNEDFEAQRKRVEADIMGIIGQVFPTLRSLLSGAQ